MTETQQHICPLGDCEYSAGSKRSVENHINGSTKPPHEGESGADHRDAIRAVAVDDPAADRGDRAKSADGSGVEQARFPASDRAEPDPDPAGDRGGDRGEADCCDDPDLVGEPGEVLAGSNHDLDDWNPEGSVTVIPLEHTQLADPQQLEKGDKVCANCEEIHAGR